MMKKWQSILSNVYVHNQKYYFSRFASLLQKYLSLILIMKNYL